MEKQLTREQTIAEHRKMWNWIAEECLRRKEKVEKTDYFIHSGYSFSHFPNNFCWCCEYYVQNRNPKKNIKISNCIRLCPIEFEGGYCTSLESSYTGYIDTEDYMEAEKYARTIANLPERPTEE